MGTRIVCLLALAGAALAAGYEAEAGALRGLEVQPHDGASGGARVKGFDALGDALVLPAVEAGACLRIRYSLGVLREQRATLALPGTEPLTVRFQPTRGWGRYRWLYVDLPVAAGALELRLEKADVAANDGQSCASLDRVEVLAERPALLDDFAVVAARVAARLEGPGPRYGYEGFAHLQSARELTLAGETGPALEELDRWLALDFQHSNWWVNDVPIPRVLGELALLLGDALEGRRRERLMRFMHQAWPPPKGGTGGAANLFYRVDAAVSLALLREDPGLLEDVFARAAAEVRVSRGEGIQEDFSFHQHGPQFYAASYGLPYIEVASRIAALAAGTAYAWPEERVGLLESFILDGLAWISYGPMLDPGAQGRNFSRKSAGRGVRNVQAAAAVLATVGSARAEELAAFPQAPSGHRCFWRSDFAVHRRPGWAVSIKMLSARTVGTESGNGEGLRQYHLADGACFVFTDGEGYQEVQPVWNWRRIPGITCEQDEEALPRIDWGRGARGTTRFVGGVSDGEHGVAALDFARDGVVARKAWFSLGPLTACLGAGIGGDGDHPVLTTVDQRRLDGELVEGEGWLAHDGIGYAALDGSPLLVESGPHTGTWRAINRRLDDTPVRHELLWLGFDHGVRPADARYAYALLPGRDAEATAAFAARPELTVLANGPALQAVRHDALGLTGLVFWEAGERDGIAADRPCVVLVGPQSVALADPAWSGEPVTVRVDGESYRFTPVDGQSVVLPRE